MPWRIVKEGKGYFVETISTGRKHSKEPISKSKADAQLRVLEMSENKKRKK